MEAKPKRVKAKSVVEATAKKITKREMWATVAYHYPQYTLEEASKLSVRDIKLLLRVASKIKAQDKYDLTQIAAAPHTKKGSGVKKLTEHFRKEIN